MGRLHRHSGHILDLVTADAGARPIRLSRDRLVFPELLAVLDPERSNLSNLCYEVVGDELAPT